MSATDGSPRFGEIAFDLDGTLIDSDRDIASALNAVLADLGRPQHPLEVVRTMIGHGAEALLRKSLAVEPAGAGGGQAGAHHPGAGEAEIDPALLAAARARFKDAYAARLLETTVPYPGIIDALEALSAAGCLLVIATNKPSIFARPIVDRLGLTKAGIAALACADEVARRKPDPAVIHLALERGRHARAAASSLSAPGRARAVLYVGDMPVDVETARAAGIASAGVRWGFDPSGIAAAAPDDMLDDAAALVRLILGGRVECEGRNREK